MCCFFFFFVGPASAQFLLPILTCFRSLTSELLHSEHVIAKHWEYGQQFHGVFSWIMELIMWVELSCIFSVLQCLLVKGWKAGASWSFPRGKKNKDEEDCDCAVREVCFLRCGYRGIKSFVSTIHLFISHLSSSRWCKTWPIYQLQKFLRYILLTNFTL
jgi:hypothetical protein